MSQSVSPPPRTDGYAPISSYAAIGDGRTAALVAKDGAIDWLCLPAFDGHLVLASLLDPHRAGRFELAPAAPYRVTRGYVEDTNVLRTELSTAEGVVAVTDGMGVGEHTGLLVRRVEGLAGRVPMRWRIRPRAEEGVTKPRDVRRTGAGVVLRWRDLAIGLAAHGAESLFVDGELRGEVTLPAREPIVLALASDTRVPSRERAEAALDDAIRYWRNYHASLQYDGHWRQAVLRSALALKLLVYEPTGAVAAAPTTSLPEAPGGSRNYDYRFCWLRDASFAVDAFVRLGDARSAQRFLAYLGRVLGDEPASPRPCYTVAGLNHAGHSWAPLRGYRGAQPVSLGNAAAGQRQLGTYGDLLQAATVFADNGGEIGPALAALLARFADAACETWTCDDAGIWEWEFERPNTWSKMACWVALDRALELVADGCSSARQERWRRAARRIRRYVEERCWSDAKQSYVGTARGDELDAATLLGVLMDYPPLQPQRFHQTVERLEDELGAGELLWRTSRLQGQEATFLPCAFWRVHALSRLGRLDEAAAAMEALVARANDVGLYGEELAVSGEMLGNFPLALTHSALVNAAVTLHQQERGER